MYYFIKIVCPYVNLTLAFSGMNSITLVLAPMREENSVIHNSVRAFYILCKQFENKNQRSDCKFPLAYPTDFVIIYLM